MQLRHLALGDAHRLAGDFTRISETSEIRLLLGQGTALEIFLNIRQNPRRSRSSIILKGMDGITANLVHVHDNLAIKMVDVTAKHAHLRFVRHQSQIDTARFRHQSNVAAADHVDHSANTVTLCVRAVVAKSLQHITVVNLPRCRVVISPMLAAKIKHQAIPKQISRHLIIFGNAKGVYKTAIFVAFDRNDFAGFFYLRLGYRNSSIPTSAKNSTLVIRGLRRRIRVVFS